MSDEIIPVVAVPVVADADAPALARFEREIVAINVDSPMDEVLRVKDFVAALTKELGRLKDLIDARGIEWCQHNRKALAFAGPSGFMQGYYVKKSDKSVKCVNPGQTFLALMDATTGDVCKIQECLAANAFKYGVMRDVLGPEKWAECFTETTTDKLEAGTPLQLTKFNAAFNKK